jgi:DNA-directed RNA polymerase subunit RPC12/RpoP/Zn finger protein HypA/HybF involved in hydrogenase expression
MAKSCSVCKKKLGFLERRHNEPEGIFCNECFEKLEGKLIKERERKEKIIHKNDIKCSNCGEWNSKQMPFTCDYCHFKNYGSYDPKRDVIELKRKCKECGKVWHSLANTEFQLQGQLKTGRSQGMTAALGMMAGNWSAANTSAQVNRNIAATQSELDRLRCCPNCGSHNYIQTKKVLKNYFKVK